MGGLDRDSGNIRLAERREWLKDWVEASQSDCSGLMRELVC